VSAAPGLRRVLELVAPTVRSAAASGGFIPSGYATPVAVASYALEHPGLLVVTATSTESEQLAEGVRALMGPEVEVCVFGAWDTHPLERVSPDSSVMAERAVLRWRLASGERPDVVVAPIRALAQILAPEQPLPPLRVLRGEERDRDEFIAELVRYGYRRESLVEHRAEFAVRGGIVDVWPAHANEPVRLDFFGDEIERLTTFDIATQRSTTDLHQVDVGPAREWVPSSATRTRAEELIGSDPWGREVLDRIAQGQLFDGMEGWMPLFASQRRTLLDEVGDLTCLVVEPERVRRRLEELLDEERELTDVVAQTWRANAEVALLHNDYDQVLAGRIDVALEPGAGPGEQLSLTSPPVVQGDPARIAAHVRTWEHGRRGVVLTSNAAAVERMAGQLRSEGLAVTTDPEQVLEVRLSVLASALPAGFAMDSPAVVVWSESDLTGRRGVHSQRRWFLR
jgi:transcription-repair coupling factor (superfamily II helicase)